MCENNNSSRIREKTQNAKTIQNLFEEKNMVDKKYTSLLGDVKDWMDTTGKHVME
jgi:hypothetical protein